MSELDKKISHVLLTTYITADLYTAQLCIFRYIGLVIKHVIEFHISHIELHKQSIKIIHRKGRLGNQILKYVF